MTSIMHDVAFLVALEILEKLSGRIPIEAQRETLWAIYEEVRKGLSRYEAAAARRTARLQPGRN